MFANELWRYVETAAMDRELKNYLDNLELVFSQEKMGSWCDWEQLTPYKKYFFSLAQSNIKQLEIDNFDEFVKRFNQIINQK